jgi:uncharacterized DUF497 family protein
MGNVKLSLIAFLIKTILVYYEKHLFDGLTITIKAKIVEDELRYLSIGRINLNLYTAIWTKRYDKIRLISVRKSRKLERTIYEKKENESGKI